MDITTGAQQELRYPAARLNENWCLQVWGGDPLKSPPLCSMHLGDLHLVFVKEKNHPKLVLTMVQIG